MRYQDNLPGGGLTYGLLNQISVNWLSTPVFNTLGDAAFLGFTNDGRGVLTGYDVSAGATPATRRRLIALNGDNLPGADPGSVAFVSFAPAINQSGAVAFRAVIDDLAGTIDWGVWGENASLTLGKVVLTTDPVPNFSTASWTRFGDPVINMNYEKAFVGRHEREVGGQTLTKEGVYWASNANFIQRVAE